MIFLISGAVVIAAPSVISNEDKPIITELFQQLMIDDQFAYTLFDSKPMSHTGIFFDTDSRNFLPKWKIWKKYQTQLLGENFVFLENASQELFEIHFINKKSTIDIISKHLSTFQKILGNKSPNEILDAILNSDDIYVALGESQILYGILFGYGESNSRGFLENRKNHIPFHNEMPKNGKLCLPYFRAYNSRETINLRIKYNYDRKRILSMYSRGDFLEITLQKLAEK